MENNRNLKADEVYYERVVSSSLRITFIALLFILSFLIIEPFLVMVIWGIIISVGIYPIFKKLSKVLGGKDKLASMLLTLSALALLIAPSVLLLDSTIKSIQNIAAEYDAGTLKVAVPPEDVAEWPLVGKPIHDTWKLASINLEAALRTLEPQIKEYGPKLVDAITGLGGTIFLSIISIIIAGVMLLKGETGEQVANKIFALFIGKYGDGFTAISVSTIRSVVQGVLGVVSFISCNHTTAPNHSLASCSNLRFQYNGYYSSDYLLNIKHNY